MMRLITAAINALLCLVVVVTLAPLAKTLRDDGAPEWFALIFLAIAGVALLAMPFYLYQMIREGRRKS